ncbi:MAG: type VI secretion system baseplate subunit TssE [Xanthomonadales bacterium]|nr:type VI secretion system baseplate subunit TssE [Xanthomonadales bacterium]
MAELSLKERLQPSLLDRLTDNEPASKVESSAQRVLSLNRLRRSVLRDLAWLLNTGNPATTEDLTEYPQVENSVLNYGVSDLAGATVTGRNIPAMEREVRQAIVNFEPRILEKSLKVRIDSDDEKMSIKSVTFKIEGQLWAQPLPIALYLSTDLDLDTGGISVSESSN